MIGPSGAVSVLLVNSFEGRPRYAEYLRTYGLSVCSVATPEEALAALSRVAPSVIVLDSIFLRSAYDDAAFIRALRHREDCRHTPVLVISAYRREQDRDQARKAG